MSTRDVQIRAAIIALLQANAAALGIKTVADDAADLFATSELPAINVKPGSYARADEFSTLSEQGWRTTVALSIDTRGASAANDASAIHQALHTLIFTDSAIGTLCARGSIRSEGAECTEPVGADSTYRQRVASYSFVSLLPYNTI